MFFRASAVAILVLLASPVMAQQIASPAAEQALWCIHAFHRITPELRARDAAAADRLAMLSGALQMTVAEGISASATQADIDSFQSSMATRVAAELQKGAKPSFTFDQCLETGAEAVRALQPKPPAMPVPAPAPDAAPAAPAPAPEPASP